MRIGVAKEIKPQEYRVALTPAGARELVQRGHEVVVEASAGVGSAFSDDAYERAGASIGSVDHVWGSADLLLKVKEPIAPEYPRLREDLTLFTYLHIAADEPLTRALAESGITAIAYETVETDRGALPLLAPMSEIAGRLAAQAGADQLEKPKGGRGILLGGVAGVAPGRVLVIGGGMVGYNAAVIALGMGAQVTILERSVDRMRYLEQILSGRVQLLMSSALQLEESIKDADLTIGAVLIPGALAPKLVTREMLPYDEGELGLRRRRDRPGRLRRNVEADDARRSRIHRRRRHPLLRCEHARRRADHVDACAHERDAPVRRTARRSRHTRRGDGESRARTWCEHARRKAHVRSGRGGARHGVHAARRRPRRRRRLSHP